MGPRCWRRSPMWAWGLREKHVSGPVLSPPPWASCSFSCVALTQTVKATQAIWIDVLCPPSPCGHSQARSAPGPSPGNLWPGGTFRCRVALLNRGCESVTPQPLMAPPHPPCRGQAGIYLVATDQSDGWPGPADRADGLMRLTGNRDAQQGQPWRTAPHNPLGQATV